jgi:hypothetical protein
MQVHHLRFRVVVIIALAVLVQFATETASLAGSIFTTDANGTVVNGNTYDDACDVYLNGGPPPNAPCWAAGLPDGEYYFQITDPNGSTLLSTDNIEQRRVVVDGGLIVGYLGASGDCVHQVGSGKCADTDPDNISVQLMPFAETPNPGGVYKVWMTKVTKYNPANPQSKFGFLPQYSKTDNFKIEDGPGGGPQEHTSTIVVNKYFDANGSGEQDADDEVPLDGVRFQVCYTLPGDDETCVVVTAGDDGIGQALVDLPAGSLITICELLPATGDDLCQWIQTQPHAESPNAVSVNEQWCYTLQTPNNADSVFTFVFGDLSVCEITKAKSTGFWKSTSGKNVLSKKDPAWRSKMNALPLRTINGKDLVVSDGSFSDAYAGFRQWMASSSFTNMASQLSQHLAAVRLSVCYSGLNHNQRVLIPESAAAMVGLSDNVIQIKTAVTLAKETLTEYGRTGPSHPQRQYQEGLKIILKAISLNALPIVNPSPAPIVYP